MSCKMSHISVNEIERHSARAYTLSKFCHIWFLLWGDFSLYIGNSAGIITVSEIFIYKYVYMESQSCLCHRACLCLHLTYFGTNRICLPKLSKSTLIEYKCEKKCILSLDCLLPVDVIALSVSFIH